MRIATRFRWGLDNGSRWYTTYRNTSEAAFSASAAGDPGWQLNEQRAWNTPWWQDNSGSRPPAGTPRDTVAPTAVVGAGIGRLWVTGHLKGAFMRVQQCPAVYDGETTDASSARNYVFNPHLALRSAPSGALMKQTWFKTMSKHGRVKGEMQAMNVFNNNYGNTVINYGFGERVWALALDPIIAPGSGPQWGAMTHVVKDQHAVNLCRSDGSVVTAIIPKTIARAGGDWSRFLDLLGYIEEAAADRGTGSTWTAGQHAIVPVNP